MQYAHRKLQRSVTEMRRSRTGRPRVSTGCIPEAYGTDRRRRSRTLPGRGANRRSSAARCGAPGPRCSCSWGDGDLGLHVRPGAEGGWRLGSLSRATLSRATSARLSSPEVDRGGFRLRMFRIAPVAALVAVAAFALAAAALAAPEKRAAAAVAVT